jgi:hypothetical protein
MAFAKQFFKFDHSLQLNPIFMKTHFQQLMFASLFFMVSLVACSQDDKSKRPSPPAKVTETVNGKNLIIDYSRPSVKGRKIFGDLEPYGKVWRTGANEATTFEVDKDVTIDGKALLKGKYALFTIPTETEWTVIFNKEPNQWGAYKYDEKKDALRIKVAAKAPAKPIELMTISADKSGVVTIGWETKEVSFKVQ